MRSGRMHGLSEYTSQRLAELQALRESSTDPVPRPPGSSDPRSTSSYTDEGLGTSRSASSGSDGVTSPDTAEGPSPGTGPRVSLPSARLEGRRGVGYTSLALPPDGTYRPLRSKVYGEENYRSYGGGGGGGGGGITGSGSCLEDSRIEPLPVIPVLPVSDFREDVGVRKREEAKKKSATFDGVEGGSKSLAIATDSECIGFAKLPDQIHRKAIKRGFDFTLMVVGESGLGKSTLLTSMFFQNDLYKDRTTCGADDKIMRTVEIEKRQIEIEELGVRLRLTIVDTPGFGDPLNASESWKTVHKYIQDQFEQYLHGESGLNRQTIQDNRVHCCLYFVSPYGRGLRQIDIDFMRRLQHRVNIVPIIAKADVLTPKELKQFKSKLMNELASHKIQIYEMPPTDNDEDEEFKRKDKEIRNAFPFAVIGGNSMIEVDGKRVQGRVYPWGIVEAENPEYSDVTLLRQFLVSTHLHDLKEVTKDVHYENFRASVLDQKTRSLSQINTKSDADKLLKEKEEEIRRMHVMLQKMQAQLHGGHAR